MNLTVVQQPVTFTYICVDCGKEINIPYEEFCDTHGDNPYDDWMNVQLGCPECGSVDHVDDFEFE